MNEWQLTSSLPPHGFTNYKSLPNFHKISSYLYFFVKTILTFLKRSYLEFGIRQIMWWTAQKLKSLLSPNLISDRSWTAKTFLIKISHLWHKLSTFSKSGCQSKKKKIVVIICAGKYRISANSFHYSFLNLTLCTVFKVFICTKKGTKIFFWLFLHVSKSQ